MCPYVIVFRGDMPPGFSSVLDELFSRHIDDHVEDLAIEMELMTF
jgi:hypothetical protein